MGFCIQLLKNEFLTHLDKAIKLISKESQNEEGFEEQYRREIAFSSLGYLISKLYEDIEPQRKSIFI